MASLWRRMGEIYAHRWTAPHGESPESGSGDTWAKGLAGITAQQLARGLESCITRADDWPPTLPEFRALCLGIPSLSSIRLELMHKAEPTRFGRAVWALIDSHAFRMAGSRDADAMVRAAYDDVREAVMRGRDLPPEPVAEIAAERSQPTPPPGGYVSVTDPAKLRAKREALARRLGLSESELDYLPAEGE